jgi:DivIVA domain-containing protein
MWILWLVVITALVLGVVMLALGRGDSLVDEEPDDVIVRMPEDRALVASDIETLRLPLALRGYQMAAVDEVLDRLAAELEIRDAEIRTLKSGSRVHTNTTDPSHADTTRTPDA